MAKKKKKRNGKAAVAARKHRLKGDSVRYKCLKCGIEEAIPREVVELFDILDDGDTSVPPRFDCEKCGETMEPIEYEGIHGEIYRIESVTEDDDDDYMF